MATTEQLRAAVDGYVRGFAESDDKAIATLFTDDATLEDPIGTPIKRGRAEIEEFYTGSVATGATLTLSGEPRCADSQVAFPFSVSLEWEGERTVIEVIDVFRLNDDGLITEKRAFGALKTSRQEA